MLNTDTEKYWSETVKQLKLLAEKEFIKSSDIGVYYSNLISVSTMYKLHLENNPMKLIFKEIEEGEIKKLEKIQKKVIGLTNEIRNGNLTHEAYLPLIKALESFTKETTITKVVKVKGKEVKLSKHQIIRIFEMLFDRYTGGVELSESYLLANEFFLAAGYIPESKKTKGLNLRKQDFDIARKTLYEAGITDRDLFFQFGWFKYFWFLSTQKN